MFRSWNKALELSGNVFEMTSGLPVSEDYGLRSQLRRSANSVGANIAEGFGRDGEKDKTRFYMIARGSAHETIHHLIYGHFVGYFKEGNVTSLTSSYQELIHDLNRLMKSFKIETRGGRS